MESKIMERKNIIGSLKSVYGVPKKGIDKRIKFLKSITILQLLLVIYGVGIFILSIFSESLGFGIFNRGKLGLLTITISYFALILPKEIYELKLLKHMKKINSDIKGIDKLNIGLKNIIEKLNNPIKNKISWITIILTLGIIVMGISQFLFDSYNYNPYWEYTVLTFYGLIFFQFISTNRKLTRNIREAEKYYNNN